MKQYTCFRTTKMVLALTLMPLLTFQSGTFAQISQREYVEFEIDNKKGDDYSLVPAGDEGVLCLLQSDEPQKGPKRAIEANFLGTSLQTKWYKKYVIDAGFNIIDQQYSKGNVYLLLERDPNRYQVMRIALQDGHATFIEYEEVKNFYITKFTVMDSIVFFGGNIKDNPAIIRYNYDEGTSVVCPSINQLKADLVEMRVDQQLGTVTAILKATNWSSDHSLYINTYDLNGKLLYNYSLPMDRQYNFLIFRPVKLNRDELLILGTYGLKSEESAQGVFALKSTGGELDFLRFYDFGYLHHFFKYLPEKQYDRITRKIKRKRDADKIYQLRYDLFVHEVEMFGDQILFAADIYEPLRDLGNNSFNQMGMWGNPFYSRYDLIRRLNFGGFYPHAFTNDPLFNRSNSIYGFEYTATFACGFDKKGNLLWDNSFTFDDVEEASYPMEFTNVFVDRDSVVFMQAAEEELRYKISDIAAYTDSVTIDSLNYRRGSEKSGSFENGGIADWYGSNFLVSGLRDIRNKLDNDFNREVFFIQKINIYPPRMEE